MVYHNARPPRKEARNTSFTQPDLVPCGSTPPFSFLDSSALECAVLTFSFQRFLTSRHSDRGPFPSYYSLTKLLPALAHRELCPIRCTGAAIHKCFMWLLSPTSLSPDPDSWRRILGAPQLRSPAHVLPTITDAADVMQLPTVDGMQHMECDMVCAIRHAMDSAMCDEGTAFLLLLSACCHGMRWHA